MLKVVSRRKVALVLLGVVVVHLYVLVWVWFVSGSNKQQLDFGSVVPKNAIDIVSPKMRQPSEFQRNYALMDPNYDSNSFTADTRSVSRANMNNVTRVDSDSKTQRHSRDELTVTKNVGIEETEGSGVLATTTLPQSTVVPASDSWMDAETHGTDDSVTVETQHESHRFAKSDSDLESLNGNGIGKRNERKEENNNENAADDWFDISRAVDSKGEKMRLLLVGTEHSATGTMHTSVWQQCSDDFLVSDKYLELWHWHNCVFAEMPDSVLSDQQFATAMEVLNNEKQPLQRTVLRWVDFSFDVWGVDESQSAHWRYVKTKIWKNLATPFHGKKRSYHRRELRANKRWDNARERVDNWHSNRHLMDGKPPGSKMAAASAHLRLTVNETYLTDSEIAESIRKRSAVSKQLCDARQFEEFYFHMTYANKRELLLFEKTPGYWQRPLVPVLIRHTFPQCKVLVLLRNPTRRILSQLMHFENGRFRMALVNLSGQTGVDFVGEALSGLPKHFQWVEELQSLLQGEVSDYWAVCRQLLFANFVSYRGLNRFQMRPYVSCYFYALLTYLRAFELLKLEHGSERVVFETRREDDWDTFRVLQFENAMADVTRTVLLTQCWSHCQSMRCSQRCEKAHASGSEHLRAEMENRGLGKRICARNKKREALMAAASGHFHDHSQRSAVFQSPMYAPTLQRLDDYFAPCNSKLRQLFDVFPFVKLGFWNTVDSWAHWNST